MRKAAATRVAENGATGPELEAIFGWSGGRLATLYTKGANRGRLAAGAIGKLDRAETKNGRRASGRGAGGKPKSQIKSAS
jgi:hypothetical protein